MTDISAFSPKQNVYTTSDSFISGPNVDGTNRSRLIELGLQGRLVANSATPSAVEPMMFTFDYNDHPQPFYYGGHIIAAQITFQTLNPNDFFYSPALGNFTYLNPDSVFDLHLYGKKPVSAVGDVGHYKTDYADYYGKIRFYDWILGTDVVSSTVLIGDEEDVAGGIPWLAGLYVNTRNVWGLLSSIVHGATVNENGALQSVPITVELRYI